jgi:chromosome segregation ATPase
MCDPVTAAVVAGGLSLYQGVQANKQAQAQAENMRMAQEANSVMEQNARTQNTNSAVLEENKQREATAQLAARQKASLGAKGVEVDSGSAQAIQDDTLELGTLDALQIRENARIQNESSNQQSELNAWSTEANANSTEDQGKAALIGGIAGAAGSFAQAGAVNPKWFNAKSAAKVTASRNFGTIARGSLGSLT